MRTIIAFVLMYFAFDRLAAAMGSTRGEAGLVICAVIVALTMLVERWLTRAPLRACVVALGLDMPAARALLAAAALVAALLACLPLLAALTGVELALRAGAAWLALGMAIAWSFPLAWLFDRAHGSIWPGALVHAAMQSGIKLLVDDAAQFQSLAIAWVALGMAAPWLLFLIREPREGRLRPDGASA